MLRKVGLYQAVTTLGQGGLCMCPDRLGCTRLYQCSDRLGCACPNRLGCDYVHNQYPMPFIISLVMITLLLKRKFLDFTCIYSPFLFHWYLYSLLHWYSATHLVLVTHLSALPHLYWLLTCQLYFTCTGYSCQLYFTCTGYLSALLHL